MSGVDFGNCGDGRGGLEDLRSGVSRDLEVLRNGVWDDLGDGVGAKRRMR